MLVEFSASGTQTHLVHATQPGETLYFHIDGHGSTRALTDAVGMIATVASALQLFHFDAYGNPLGFNPAQAATNFLYNNEQRDIATGLYNFRARPYDPRIGRLLGLDPFAGDLLSPQSFHKYTFAQSDPIQGVDPTGLLTIAGLSLGTLGTFAGYGAFFGASVGFQVSAWDAFLGGKSPSEILNAGFYGGGLGGLIGLLLGPIGGIAVMGAGPLAAVAQIVVIFERSIAIAAGFSSVNSATTPEQAVFRYFSTWIGAELSLLGVTGRPGKPIIRRDRSTITHAADLVRAVYEESGVKTPGGVALMDTPFDGSLNGVSGKSSKHHPVVQMILDIIAANGRNSRFHGDCAEVDAVDVAAYAIEKRTGIKIRSPQELRSYLEGSKIQTGKVRQKSGHTEQGRPNEPCEHTCEDLLDTLGIEYYEGV